VGSTSPSLQIRQADEPIVAPKGALLPHLWLDFQPLCRDLLPRRGHDKGAKGRDRHIPSHARTVHVGHAPVVAVLLASASHKQARPSRPPKGADNGPQAFSPANRQLPGDRERGHHRHLGPQPAAACSGAKAMPPVVAVLVPDPDPAAFPLQSSVATLILDSSSWASPRRLERAERLAAMPPVAAVLLARESHSAACASTSRA
jgi:hypothetical protein